VGGSKIPMRTKAPPDDFVVLVDDEVYNTLEMDYKLLD
jgi:hypothetical protein